MSNMQATAAPAARYPLWAIILSCAAIAGVGMGLRQVMGLYQKDVTSDLGIGRASFSLAIAIANISWGIAAPFTGAVADKYGTGRVVVFGAINTVLGILLMYFAWSETILLLSGVLMGLGVSGAGVNATVGAVSRAAAPAERSAAIAKIGMGAGVGVFLALPYTHLLMGLFGWKTSLFLLAMTALVMLPLAIPIAGKPAAHNPLIKKQTLREALAEAIVHPSFWLLNAGFFVCGFHVVFYGTHLPAYVSDKGLESFQLAGYTFNTAVVALTVVGIGNLIGTYVAGQWGKYRPKRIGLSLIYFGRMFVFLAFLFVPITPLTVILLSATLGLLWLSTVPLTSSLVGTFFGPTWMTMLYGIVFFSHQIGSFLGVWMAGLVFDATKSYDLMWWISVGLGAFAALIHWPIRERPVARLETAMAPAAVAAR
jgi:predicted MFS family arabinose efflux permease